MTVDDVLNYFGSGYAMNKAVGVSATNIRNWVSYGYVPFQMQIKLQRLTNGGLKIDEKAFDKEIDDRKNGIKTKKGKSYGFSKENYNNLFAIQNGCCAICKQPEKTVDPRSGKIISLALDHDHITGKARGLLCGNCNRMLGFSKDNIVILKNSLIYLKKHSKDKVNK